ncbi:MAG: hypothetical protein PHO62_04580 [Sulfurimonas sp.]|uniref:hypothetical protein n=1 Tax=Sulfurimonas sp. TaxID=2022749 RepID=UPI00260FD54E|nr:hypothetical protein [Sulfurimonas sp.]MDD5372688.1 hypothetical protein [Sulfurimonas sp.]
MQQNRVGEQKYCRLLGHFSLILFVCFATLNAEQSFKDFKTFKKTQIQSFQTYKDERDTAFSNYLKQEWQAYNALAPVSLYETPKPVEIDSVKPQEIEPVGPKIIIAIKEDEKKEEPAVFSTERKDISFDFYGSTLGFNIPSGIKNANFSPATQAGIANFFNSAASSEYETLLLEIEKISKSMNLNDWGVYLLVTKLSDKATTNQDNSKLLSWFLFNKMGYAVKVGLADNHAVLMHYSQKTIYSTPNYSFENKKYYVVSNYAKGNLGKVYSYKQEYQGATKALDLSLETLPNFKEKIESKTLTFSQFGNSYNIPITYNKNLIDFMATYPQADYETFFNAPLDSKTYADLATELKKYIDGKKASEAINFVLNFVQKSFKYEQDNRQFGREKVMFAQETLYFDKSDCEDRAVLFAYLVKELFDINVLGVKYKDHMATALYIPLEGDKITAGSRKFVIADPTYIDATIGMSMPKYRSIQPQSYIVVKNSKS